MPDAMECLTRVLSSKVCDITIESSLQLTTKLSDHLRVSLWLKHEGQVLDKILFFHPADCPILLRLCLNVQNTTGVSRAELQKRARDLGGQFHSCLLELAFLWGLAEHALVAGPASLIFGKHKVRVFYSVRLFLGLI
jgi:hypothetical protein